ncbi:hypothetical protein O181_105358 [Austropuccinia psidii MF-1]|uniref:Uncharacterized protein n=1 Tax=Austropuccinia psidii MF-1 TaxID=1389203 RepID=A0A9Q3JLY2_9BASI|nr:hypothetical protein [Austropuccinia psidii MF-1]
MTTRRGSQHSSQSDGAGLRGRMDSAKGKRNGNIPSGTESTQESALSQRQVLEMPMISEPELELSMSNSNRYKSHSEGSNRHLHEPVQTVIHSVQRQGLGNVASNTPRSDELLAHPENVPQRQEIVRYSNGWNPLSSKPQIKKIKAHHAKKTEASKEEAPVAFTSKLPKRGRRTRKRIGGNHIPRAKGFQKSKKIPWKISSTWPEIFMEFKDKEEQRMRQPHFPKK